MRVVVSTRRVVLMNRGYGRLYTRLQRLILT